MSLSNNSPGIALSNPEKVPNRETYGIQEFWFKN